MSNTLHVTSGGCETPGEIFSAVAAADTPPQYWGDTTLLAKINALADRTPPLVRIEGPTERLPQWESPVDLNHFVIKALSNKPNAGDSQKLAPDPRRWA